MRYRWYYRYQGYQAEIPHINVIALTVCEDEQVVDGKAGYRLCAQDGD